MSSVYSRILKTRKDMTEWLIHFTHATKVGSARDLLLRIASEGLLRPSWAVRSIGSDRANRPTIYGPNPAVCFTEQPISAFTKYLDAHQDRSRLTGYGLLVHKHDAYADGALPVIYGLSNAVELKPGDEDYQSDRRILREDCLPLDEQYRYLSFAPTKDPHPIDWSHEREWRWSPVTGNQVDGCFALAGSGMFGSRGHSDGRVHLFVDADADVAWLQQGLLAHLNRTESSHVSDRGSYSQWRRALSESVRIISLERARQAPAGGSEAHTRMEDWPPQDLHPALGAQVAGGDSNRP